MNDHQPIKHQARDYANSAYATYKKMMAYKKSGKTYEEFMADSPLLKGIPLEEVWDKIALHNSTGKSKK